MIAFRVVGAMPLEPKVRTYGPKFATREAAEEELNTYRAMALRFETPHKIGGKSMEVYPRASLRFRVTTQRAIEKVGIQDSWNPDSPMHFPDCYTQGE